MNRYLLIAISSLAFLFSGIWAKTSDSKDWFAYAKNDLKAAQILIDTKDPLIGVALYHIEQASEKALKALLIACNTSFALTHDLKILLKNCTSAGFDLHEFCDDIAEINPYATKSRYPNKSYIEPAMSTVKSYIKRAALLLAFVQTEIDCIVV